VPIREVADASAISPAPRFVEPSAATLSCSMPDVSRPAPQPLPTVRPRAVSEPAEPPAALPGARFDRNLRCVWANEAFGHLLGPEAGNPVGRYLRDFPPAIAEAWGWWLDQVLRTARPVIVDVVLPLSETPCARCLQLAPVMGADGAAAGVMLFVAGICAARYDDLAELAVYRQHLEELVAQRTAELRLSHEQLHSTQRLASVGTLAAGIAHEINSPLNAILMTAEYALRSQDPDAVAEALATIIDQALRGGRVVKSVLNFVRDETTPKVPGDFNDVVRHAGDLARTYLGEEVLTLDLELADGLPPVAFNHTEIEQLLLNLVRNASQAVGGQVRVTIRTQRDAGWVKLTVSDDGPGIAPEDLPHIFDAFFSTRRAAGGTGLGLSICHNIVASHGGTIQAESGPGHGATFVVRLPVASSPPPAAGPGGSRKVAKTR
jgi:signal transduction histidine kinase